MDHLLTFARDAKESSGFAGSTEEFKGSPDLVTWCIRNRRIVRISSQELSRTEKDRYTDFLVTLLREYLKANPHVTSWSDFASRPENNKVRALFHLFGVRGEVFGVESFQGDDIPQAARSRTNLTFEEFYEMCQIQFHYQGSFGSFKKLISKKYGSFAEYCILKGLDINGTKWESDETATRVAKKLGSIEAIKYRAASLFKYLSDRDLLDQIFSQGA